MAYMMAAMAGMSLLSGMMANKAAGKAGDAAKDMEKLVRLLSSPGALEAFLPLALRQKNLKQIAPMIREIVTRMRDPKSQLSRAGAMVGGVAHDISKMSINVKDDIISRAGRSGDKTTLNAMMQGADFAVMGAQAKNLREGISMVREDDRANLSGATNLLNARSSALSGIMGGIGSALGGQSAAGDYRMKGEATKMAGWGAGLNALSGYEWRDGDLRLPKSGG